MEKTRIIKSKNFIGFKCFKCGAEVWFPLCPDAATNKHEQLAWDIYQTWLNLPKEKQLCWRHSHKFDKPVRVLPD
jgi:hypothetical protein